MKFEHEAKMHENKSKEYRDIWRCSCIKSGESFAFRLSFFDWENCNHNLYTVASEATFGMVSKSKRTCTASEYAANQTTWQWLSGKFHWTSSTMTPTACASLWQGENEKSHWTQKWDCYRLRRGKKCPQRKLRRLQNLNRNDGIRPRRICLVLSRWKKDKVRFGP